MYNKILLAADGSETSLKAAETTSKLVKNGFAKEVVILHVAPSIVNSYYDLSPEVFEYATKKSKEASQEILDKTKGLFPEEAKVETMLRFGETAEAICEVAKDGFDLVIMGSRGMNPLSGLMLGSVSTRVIHYSPCPVLIVK